MTHSATGLRPARKVLVIDDEEAFCVLLARMISKQGYKVMTSNQAKSMHLDEMMDSNIIFIDIVMPEMDGIRVLQLLSSHQIKSKIVLMSGADNAVLTKAESFAKRYDLRLIGVLNKPFWESGVCAILAADQRDYRRSSRKPLTSEINMEDVLAEPEPGEKPKGPNVGSRSIASALEFRPYVRSGGKSGYLAFIKLASIRI